VAIGDDVLVRLQPGLEGEQGGRERVLIMQLVRRSTVSVELHQFNPDLTVRVDAADVEAILKIPGELI
jgi:hypothetical protein